MIFGHAAGPDAGVSGAPGENTCWQSQCHLSSVRLNEGGGSIQLTASSGTTYSAGQKITFTMTGTDAAARLWGFEASVKDANNKGVGTFTPATGQGVLCADQSVRPASGCGTSTEYIIHTRPFVSARNATINFDWTPPAQASGDVTVYIAVNAGNGDGAQTGDHIYTTSLKLTAGSSDPGNRPAVSDAGVTNGASFQPVIQAGSWATVKGTNLANNTRIWGDSDIVNGNLPTSLDGTSIKVAGKSAAIYFISAGQINFQVPDLGDQTGDVPVEITTPTGTVTTTARVQSVAPAFFMFDAEDRKYIAGLTQDFKFLGKQSLFPTLTIRPARPGETVQLYGTGFGATNPATPALKTVTAVANTANRVTATVGGVDAVVQFAGLVAAGEDQINIVVPASLPDGDHKVVTTVNGVSSPDNAFITVQR
jgi:uncharacterized protein (TIGR03437 family)